MIPITLALMVVQEMASRMGAVTGKGLSDLIREEFGFRVTFLMMSALVVTNFGNIVAEFAGMASSLELFGISQVHTSVPVAAAASGCWSSGHLRDGREDLPRGVGFLRRLHRCRPAGASRLESGGARGHDRAALGDGIFSATAICSW